MNNEKIKSFKDLNAWKEGHALVLDVYKQTRKFPKEETFGLTNQIRRAVVSITSNIAEGFSRNSFKEKINFYGIALGSLTEVENQLIIARDVGYINEVDFKEMINRVLVLNKIINGLIKKSRSFLLSVLIFLLLTSCFIIHSDSAYAQSSNTGLLWKVQSIDTMKYSRDEARTHLNSTSFEATINAQIKAIAETGATHVAIATPYDAEFKPFLRAWVASARKHGLKVWFRGNWSGWEGWFNYPKITQAEHLIKTEDFIFKNADIFEDGDIFTACPECENGGPGDPRLTRKIEEYRKFLIDEHKMMERMFKKISRNVIFNYNSMNGDVAFLIMNKETTQALGGVITIDHYVKTKERLISDIRKLSAQGGGARIVLGEFGAPIPDIHGKMSEVDQAKWVQDAFLELAKEESVEGINYWVNVGGSTELWDSKLNPRSVVNVMMDFYSPEVVTGYVSDELNRPIENATVSDQFRTVETDSSGYFELPYIYFSDSSLTIKRDDFSSYKQEINNYIDEPLIITLNKQNESFGYSFLKFIKNFVNALILFFSNTEIEIERG